MSYCAHIFGHFNVYLLNCHPGLARDARGVPAAQPADDAGRRRLRPQPPVCRGSGGPAWSRRFHETCNGESAESRFGDKPEAGIGTDEVRFANEIRAMICVKVEEREMIHKVLLCLDRVRVSFPSGSMSPLELSLAH